MPRRAISADGPGCGRGDPNHGLQQRRFAGAVASEQGQDFVLAHVERDGVEDVALAVECVDLVDDEERRRPGR
jgi:hypothetical protein